MKLASFDNFLVEVESNAHKKAAELGLQYKGFGHYHDARTGKITHKTVDGELVPIKGSPIMPDAGGPGDPDQLKDRTGVVDDPNKVKPTPGAGVGPAPEPGDEQNPDNANWHPGPHGDHCVGDQPAPDDLSFDMFVGKTNYYKWTAGKDGTNFANMKDQVATNQQQKEELSFDKFIKEEGFEGLPAPRGADPKSNSEKLQQQGFQHQGFNNYRRGDGMSAKIIGGEIIYYSANGEVSTEDQGGLKMIGAKPTWSDPVTGMAITPPAQPETPEEIAAVPSATPAQAPAGYDKFLNKKQDEARINKEISDEINQKMIEVDNVYDQHPMSRIFKMRMDNMIADAQQSQEPTENLFAAHLQDVVNEYSKVFDMLISGTDEGPKQTAMIAMLSKSAQDDAMSRFKDVNESSSLSFDKFLTEAAWQPNWEEDFPNIDPEKLEQFKKLFDGQRKSKDQGRGLYNSMVSSFQKQQVQPPKEGPKEEPKQDSNPQNPGKPDLDSLIKDVRSRFNTIQDIGGKMSANGDELGDDLVSSADGGNIRDTIKTLATMKQRDSEQVGKASDIYKVTSPGGLGSDRGRYVEQGLTDHVLPELFKNQGLDFHNDGGPRVKTDVRSSRNGEDVDRYTVKSTVGTDGLEANNAGFRRFFDMWNLDPQSGPGKMFSHLMGIPLDWAQENGFGDNMGLWDDKRDGLHRDGLSATRQMPLQMMYPGFKFGSDELNANSMRPETFERLFPNESKEGMEWLMDNRGEVARRIMSQRDNDFGPDGNPDPNARPNVDFDPNPVNRAAWYHLKKSSKGSPFLDGRLDVHDVSPDQIKKVIEKAQWNLSPSISGGLSLDLPFEGRGGKRSLMTLSRKANKAGGGRYGNGFHSPRFAYKHNSFDPFPHVSSTPVKMAMGAKQSSPALRKDGSQSMSRDGKPKMNISDGKILPGSVQIGKTNWGKGYEPKS